MSSDELGEIKKGLLEQLKAAVWVVVSTGLLAVESDWAGQVRGEGEPVRRTNRGRKKGLVKGERQTSSS